MFEPYMTVTSKNVSDFMPDETTISKASEILYKMGFGISRGVHSLSIYGPIELFESVFKIRLTLEKGKGETLAIKSDIPIDVPLSMKNYAEKIFFPEPPEYFG